MRNAFADVIYEMGASNDRICALVADISPAGSMVKFREQFPERFINTGVAEQAMIGIAAGLALKGMRPFCYTIATFSLYRPFEMIRVDLCYQNLPVTVVGMGAGVIYSTLGGTHHSMEDIAVASALPNMTVLAPCDPEEMRVATRWCGTRSAGPVYMRLGKAGEPDLTLNAIEPCVIGKIRYLKKGNDIALISYGITMKMVFELAHEVEKGGQSVSIISCHTLKPLDRSRLIQMLSSHKKVVVIEEHVPQGSLGSQIKNLAWDIKANCLIKTISLKDEFIHFYGTHEELLNAHDVSVKKILLKIER